MIDVAACALLEFDKILSILSDSTLSPQGREQASHVVPIQDQAAIELQLEQVSEMKSLLQFDDPFPLEHTEDIRPAIGRCSAVGIALDPEAILEIGRVLKIARQVKEYIQHRQTKYLLLSEMVVPVQPFPEFERRIAKVFDEKGEVSDQASEALRRIRTSLKREHDHLRSSLEKMLETLSAKGLVQEPLITIREGRFVLPVKTEHRSRVKGIVHDQSSSGATLFIEPLSVVEFNNKLRELEIEEKREIHKILTELTDWIRLHEQEITAGVMALGDLDVVHAKARLSIEYDGTRPLLNRSNRVRLKKARHPLLERRKKATRGHLVPLDIELGDRFRTLIITGPNAGGKTVALKTVGLLTLMVQSGFHVPAAEGSELAIFDHIYTDIGDRQSIEQDLSSFSAHLQQLKKILDEANDRTLVLIDELGAGTDPDEGSALGMAVLEVLTGRGGCTLVTTHHGALKAFAHQHPEMENGSMEFDHQTLKPAYRFCLGVPGSSYAFHIANRLGMDPQVTSLAVSHMGEKGRKVEELIVQLHHSLQDCEAKRHSADERDGRLKRLVSEYEDKVLSAQKEGARIRQTAYEQADGILARVNALVENAVAEIRRTQAAPQKVKDIRAEIADVRHEVDHTLEELKTEDGEEIEDVAVGQEVWIPALQARGTVLNRPDSGRRVLILAGKATVQLPLSHLRSVQTDEKSPRHSTGWVRYSTERDISTEVDVRGLTGDEACQAIEKYLDDAFVAGLGLVRIIHGKGTGALRQRIGRYLENHLRVKSTRMGDWNEGGAGVMLVELKQG